MDAGASTLHLKETRLRLFFRIRTLEQKRSGTADARRGTINREGNKAAAHGWPRPHLPLAHRGHAEESKRPREPPQRRAAERGSRSAAFVFAHKKLFRRRNEEMASPTRGHARRTVSRVLR